MNGNDTKIGLILGAILVGGSLLKKKKAEAELAKAIEEKPPLAVVPVIPQALVKEQSESVATTVPEVGLPPITLPKSPEPTVQPISPTAPVLSTGLASQISQKLKELTQKQVIPTTVQVTTPTVTTVPTPTPTPVITLKEPIIEVTKPPPTAIIPSIVPQPIGTIVLDAKSPIPATTPPTTEVAIVKPVPTVTTIPSVPIVPTSPPTPEVTYTISEASLPFIAEIDRTIIPPEAALGSWLSKQLKSVEKHVRKEVERTEQAIRKEIKRSPVYKVIRDFRASIRKELKRTEKRIRYEMKRFERRIRKNLSAIASIVSVLGFVFPVLKVAAYALDAVATYQSYVQAKKIQKQIEGQQAYVAEVTAETERMLKSPTELATKAKGGTLGYLFKKRINSAFVPLVSVNNVELNDTFYTTMEMLPVLNAAKYIPGKAIGFICKIPFSGSVPLKLMYSFEMMDFVTVTSESGYFRELVNNGYTEVKQLGYVSKQPQEGPFTATSNHTIIYT